MGEYFYYANHDKKLKFQIGLDVENCKFSGIGYVLGTRAFCLLLTESQHYQQIYSNTLIGSWIGDQVSCIGDQTQWHHGENNYKNINANIIVMLYQIDGAEQLIEAASKYDNFFVQIAYLIFTKQFSDILPKFEQNFGKEWGKKYKNILENNYYGKVYDLVSM
jgi:hypothetical protein